MKFKTPYCDYATYQAGPFAGVLEAAEFSAWAVKATYLIDRLTHGRASVHAEALSSELAYACGQIAEVLKQGHSVKMAAVSGLAGASNDGYSETYTSAKDAAKATDRACLSILEEVLGSDPCGLLYAGVI